MTPRRQPCAPAPRRRAALGLAFALGLELGLGLGAAPACADALAEARLTPRLHAQVPLDLRFRDEAGRSVALREFLTERPSVLVLSYYGCSNLCGVVLNALTESLVQLPALDPSVVVVSIDPSDPPALAAQRRHRYTTRLGRPDAPWHFLTGEEAAIRALAEAVGFGYAREPATRQFAHVAALTILSPGGRIAGYFEGVSYPPAPLRAALDAAAQQRPAPPFERFLMRCFHYDPAESRTGSLVKLALQAFGALTALALAALVGRFWLAERRAAARRPE